MRSVRVRGTCRGTTSQRFAVVALAPVDVVDEVDFGQEVHLDLDDATALAGLAAAAGQPPALRCSVTDGRRTGRARVRYQRS